MMIWIVQGSTGEYSDRTDWVVRAYRTEKAAKEEVTRLEVLMRLYGGAGDTFDWERRRALEEEMQKVDENFRCDYTGTRYYYATVELIGE